eukprot:TRINITY_DN67282_c0_g1_i1.p1 TRINITY_DN67282_c0_g1~~TRINITY_DN67282_c0_g1_i1.p1  ORF type:complete len:422 (+),score=146.28 TRINITY_DN67282_c0_g1_i1:90-1268(+)
MGAGKKARAHPAGKGQVSGGGMVRRPPRTHRAKVAQRRMAPKLAENPKTAIFMKGEHSSKLVQDVLTDLHVLKKPWSIKFTKKNEFRPFETSQHLEFLAFKNDASLFGFGSHSKKRPHNLTLGRHFDYQLLDMVELGVTAYEAIQPSARIAPGSKPLMVFIGDGFETIPALKRVRTLLIDFFRGKVVSTINLAGLDRCLCFTLKPTDRSQEITVSEDGQSVKNATLLMRHYCVALKKSGEKVPKVELSDAGPTLNLELRRMQLATPERFGHACKLPKEIATKIKREAQKRRGEIDAMGNKYGQVHVGAQNAELGKLGTRKFTAFKKRRRDAAAAAAEAKKDAAAAEGGGRKRPAEEGEGAPQPRGGAKRRRRHHAAGAARVLSATAAPDDVV